MIRQKSIADSSVATRANTQKPLKKAPHFLLAFTIIIAVFDMYYLFIYLLLYINNTYLFVD